MKRRRLERLTRRPTTSGRRTKDAPRNDPTRHDPGAAAAEPFAVGSGSTPGDNIAPGGDGTTRDNGTAGAVTTGTITPGGPRRYRGARPARPHLSRPWHRHGHRHPHSPAPQPRALNRSGRAAVQRFSRG
ncbi:hypothetical protein GCM10011505_32260 [Tistrella bauzanensis]|uniref:Uncharacterized protein n=1 Tax=Tistrella bauzanensis TaxID=657419 RepID=A0ABQ1IT11_9PROT|nr:hypothetical protein GCM10011505_32260 [Tistrella bauzanensis]